ncbi:MAG TPA: alpha-L-rhamnosidase C-terminal domain-containing protein, partial [Bacteroidales bacterium]|nr:alpha-L-rhamnosidase C-terminal domain-containing protein [Bacteroidales bacterium]
AYKVASQETFPSWGWWIKNGATTLYENWPLDAKSDISLNHIMFGEVGAWLYKGVGGIYPDPEAPGFKNTLLKPAFPEGLDNFAAEHQSPYGKIVSRWKKDGNVIIYKVTVPANSSAALTLPEAYKAKTLPLGTKMKDDVIFLKAGTYEFQLQKVDAK